MEFIDLKKQQDKIQTLVKKNIDKVLLHGKYINGPEVKELEIQLNSFLGGDVHTISCANGTDALQIACMALDIKPGDEVITTPFSFIATVETLSLLQLKPVFVDIEENSININPALIEQAITPKTKLILPVSLYGQCANFTKINQIAKRYNLPVLEDAAQSFGAKHQGNLSCTLSDIATTSFFPSKPLGCYGDGGAIFTKSKKLAELTKKICSHGQSKRYYHTEIGVNSRLDSIQAAILLAKLTIFEEEIIQRQSVAKVYNDALSDKKFENILSPIIPQTENLSSYAQYSIVSHKREKIIKILKEHNIPTAIHYPLPLHLQPALNSLGYTEGDFPLAEKISKEIFSIPMHPYLEKDEQQHIISAIEKAINS